MKRRKIIRGQRQERFTKTKTLLAFFLIFGLVFGLGAMGVYFGYQDAVNAFASSNWPSVKGAITHSEVKVTRSRTTDSSSSTRSKTVISYQPDIRYKYQVNGPSLIGDQIQFGQVSNREIAENLVRKYRPGQSVNVYYDPDNPENSVLVSGWSFGLVFMPLLGMAAVGVAVVGAVVFFKFFWDS